MDRTIVYLGAVPQDTDILKSERNALVGIAKLAHAILGDGPFLNLLTCTPTSPASLQVQIAPGQIYQLANLDGTAFGSLPADTTHQILKQGILMDALTLSCPAPGTAGQSINYLVQVGYLDTDTGTAVLPYYNSANPSTVYNGPNNTGVSQNTIRQGVCSVTVKAGTAAATGTQSTPAADVGYIGAYVVTVANAQATIVAANITNYASAPFITDKLQNKITQTQGDVRYSLAINQTIPSNLLTNTQFKIRTAIGVITKFNKEGTGTLPLLSVSSYTTATNSPVFSCANTSQLKIGDVVKFTGADANVNMAGIEVTALTANVSFSGNLAQGLNSTTTAACSAQVVTRGDVTGSTGAGPDPWNKTNAMNLWIDDNDINAYEGSFPTGQKKYQVGLQYTGPGVQSFWYPFPARDIRKYVGRDIVFGAWINYKVRSGAGTYRVFIKTDIGTIYGTAVSTLGYQWSEITTTIPTNASTLTVGVEFNGSVSDTIYISKPMMSYGKYLGTGNYVPESSGTVFTPVVKYSASHWVNATLTFPAGLTDGVYPWTFYLKGETLEAVANEVIAAYMELEGVNNGAGRSLAMMSSTVAPQLDGPILYGQVLGVKMAAYSWLWFKNGTARVYSITASDSWGNVSTDMSAYILE